MPSDASNTVNSSGRRSHRASVPAMQTLPRPLRYALGAIALVAVLVGSLSFARAANQVGNLGADAVADVNDVSGRDDVWAQVSRSDGYREPLMLEGAEPVSFSVSVDGQTVDLTTSTATLADALIEAGVVVDLDDEVSAPMGERPDEGAQITVTRVGTQIETDVTSLPFKTVERKTSSLPSGTTQVQTKGVKGSQVTTYQATYSDGEVVSRVELTSIVANQPVNQVVLVGTGVTTTASSGSGSSGSGGSSGGSGGGSTYSGGDPRAIAQSMLGSYGWDSGQWSCLNSLWQRESNWNPYATNPSSGAYGIPQSLPASKMASAGSDWRTNPATQIKWGLGYIKSRYGSPCGAWAHSEAVGWY